MQGLVSEGLHKNKNQLTASIVCVCLFSWTTDGLLNRKGRKYILSRGKSQGAYRSGEGRGGGGGGGGGGKSLLLGDSESSQLRLWDG